MIIKDMLWVVAITLLITSIADFGTWAEGINTYVMYFLIGIIMIYILLKLASNRNMIWNFVLISGIYFVVEIFNFLYYSFFPATAFFSIYCSIFCISLVVSLVIIRKESIAFDYKDSKAPLILVLTGIAIGIGYGIQWMG